MIRKEMPSAKIIVLTSYFEPSRLNSISNSLTREEMRNVIGGRSGCAYNGGNGYYGSVGPSLSLSDVEWAASLTGSYYCCASCCSVGWLSQSDKEYIGC